MATTVQTISSLRFFEETDWIYFILEDGTRAKVPGNQIRYTLNIPYIKKDGTPVSATDIKRMKTEAEKKYQTEVGA